jgi:polyisoprenoid-binding protein YceI
MFGMRDMMLRSPFFLSAGSFPEIVFEGSGAGDDGSTFSIDGTLTAKSTSAPVTLSVELVEATANARTYKATATADRYAHGAHLPKIMEGFGTMLSPQLDIEITVKLVGA